ncbi:MAG: hypothetical protein ACRDHP_01180, partial [Ktedonobacterales bacterium]
MSTRGGRFCRLVAVLLAALALFVAGAASKSPIVYAAQAEPESSCGTGPPVAMPGSTAGSPTILLGHASGPVGMSEVITGSGWPAGARVSVDLDYQQPDHSLMLAQFAVTEANVRSDGTLSMPVFPIVGAPGCAEPSGPNQSVRVIFVAHTTDEQYFAKGVFTYAAQPTLSLTG